MNLPTKFILLLTTFFLAISSQSIAQDFEVSVFSYESVTGIKQSHNVGIGPDNLMVAIEGRIAGKTSFVAININTSNSGARDIARDCQKSAMLALHYPERYTFEITAGVPPGTNTITIGSSAGDYLICNLKKKTNLIVPLNNLSTTTAPLTN